MSSVNKVILIGNLGSDPDVKYLASGDAVCNISLATNETWKNRDGEKQQHTEWHRVTFYAKAAEVVGEYMRKGSQMYVEGRLRTRKWQDKESGQDRYTTEIIADRFQFLGGTREGGEQQPRTDTKTQARRYAEKDTGNRPAQARKPGDFENMDDDIPL